MVPSLHCGGRTVPSWEGLVLSATPLGCRFSILLHSQAMVRHAGSLLALGLAGVAGSCG